MRRIILVLIAGVLVGILGVHALLHLSVRQLLPEEFSDCSGNLSWAITLILGTLAGAGCARYFRYAAYGSYRVIGGFRAFLGRVVCMWLWYGITALLGVYAVVFVQFAKSRC